MFHRAAAKPILAQQAIISLNCVDHDGHTPLHLACIDGDVPCVVYLLQVLRDFVVVNIIFAEMRMFGVVFLVRCGSFNS